MENEILSISSRGLPGIVFGRYDKVYGSARTAMRDYFQGELPLIPPGFLAPWDHAEDTARAHIQAMHVGKPGEESPGTRRR